MEFFQVEKLKVKVVTRRVLSGRKVERKIKVSL
jgi:hypothetical protein